MNRFFRGIVPVLAFVWGIGFAQSTPLVASPGVFAGSASVPEGSLESNAPLLGSSIEYSVTVGAGITTYQYTVSARGLFIVQGSSELTSDIPDGAVLLNRIVIQTGELLDENIVFMSHSGTLGEWEGVERVKGIRFDGLSCLVCEVTIVTDRLPELGGFMADGVSADGDSGFLYSAFIGTLPVIPVFNDPRSFGRLLVPGSEINTFAVTAVPEAPMFALFLAGFVCLRMILRRNEVVS